jgi:alpha-amylase/alpha-mannosidase (GH57 family)
MNILHINKTAETPNVIFDKDNNIFEFSYRSLPENAIEFYNPVFEWIEEYSKSPNKETIINFKLEYFNTASAKQIAKILIKFFEISTKNTVKIKWYYDKNDTDMLSSGQRYSKLINLDFEFIEM